MQDAIGDLPRRLAAAVRRLAAMAAPVVASVALVLCLGVPAPTLAQGASPKTSDLVKVDLLAEPAAIRAGEPFFVGIRLRMKEHWHTYWRNPGDSGAATEVAWSLPAGFSAGDLVWPAPSLLRLGPTASYGYEGEAILLAEITPPRDLAPGSAVPLAARVDYLVCEKICIPGDAEVSISVPAAETGASPGPGPQAGVFAAARSRLPQPLPWPVRASADEKTVTLTFAAGAQAAAIRRATLFPFSDTLIDHAAPQEMATQLSGTAAGEMRLALTRSNLGTAIPPSIDGVLVVEEDIGGTTARHAFTVSAASGAGAAAPGALAGTVAAMADGQGGGALPGLLQTLFLALVAGLILNLMPCVFPVLSLKILHLTRHAGESAGRVRLHGLAYTAGILVSFAALAGVLYAIRAAGAEIGWGFQLQSPAVVAALAFVLFAMGLSLSGLLQVGTSLTRVGNSALLAAPGLGGSFFFGVLATIVATPCTAPFMGAAIGFALVQPPGIGISVFLALGLGLALPFLALSFAPWLQEKLPRPGAWMETLRQFLAFPLYATVVWLVWVLSQQVGPNGLLAALSGLVLIAFGAWLMGLAAGRSGGRARIVQGAAVASLLAAALLVVSVETDRARAGSAGAAAGEAGAEAFTQARLDALIAEGRPVFVNMTAAWCITCLVNERTALSATAVREDFKARGIVYLKGDWTNRNAEITRVLDRFGHSGVPLYVLYRRGAAPEVLPQLLTPSIVLEHTAKL